MSRLAVPIAVHVLLGDGRGRALFQRRAGTGYADGCWSLPGGHVEPGETFHDACVREVREEVAVVVRTGALRLACVQQKLDVDGQERVDVFFTSELPDGAEPRIAEPSRSDRLTWARVTAPPAPVVPYVAAALAHIRAGAGPIAYFGYP